MIDFLNKLNKVLLSSPWYWIITIGGFLIGFICYKYGSKIIGWFGEHWTKEVMNYLPKDKYHIFNDIMISINDKTYQIDHIIVSEYGIFVIETKQYNGYIKGSKYDKKWVRYIKGKEPIYYTNPIRQNYGHVKAICELLNISESKVFNIVCIPSKNVKLNIKHDGELTTSVDINEKIMSYKEEIIDNVDELKDKIIINNIVDKDKRKEHIDNINATKIEYDNNTCPKCGGELVERNGKNGRFIGCSNYPKCKYTRKA